MALKVRAAAYALLLAAVCAVPCAAQSVTAEMDVTGGASTENVRAGSTQFRVFGASASDWRFFAEATWGAVDGPPSDAFGAAYPYDGAVRPMEIFGEKTFKPGNYLLGMRGGRFRTPFGISSRGDYGYTGFVRPPLIRYGEQFALSNTWLEGGVDVFAGSPRLFVEASAGAPLDEGESRRRRGMDATVRVQGYYKSLIVGVSRLNTGRDRSLDAFAQGRAVFNGIDGRWTTDGVQLRGEWISGRPFDGVATKGGYLDLLVHRRALGPVTPLLRVERLDYDAGPFSFYLHRFTAGARVHLPGCLTAQTNVIHQPVGLAAGRTNALDAGVTCTVRR
jgi:hypothetical protein